MLRRAVSRLLVLARSGRRLLNRPPRKPWIPGLPEGLTFEGLDRLAQERHGRRLISTAYRHLSGWKQLGAYQVELRLGGDECWTLVYKDSYYGPSQIPALKGFPARVGPPEYSVFKQASGGLCRFLPEVYSAEELEPGSHYRYLMKDLSEDYALKIGEPGMQVMVQRLPEFHAALAEWGQGQPLPEFIRYDSTFYADFGDYITGAFERYLRVHESDAVRRFLATWPKIERMHRDPGFVLLDGLQPIHGDLNLRNVLFHIRQTDQVKLLDWEWAGWGQPHADLASITKHLSEAACDQALDAYARLQPRLSREEHWRRYQWYRLERGLLDAAFMAVQIVESPPQTGMNVAHFLESSLRQVQNSFITLSQIT